MLRFITILTALTVTLTTAATAQTERIAPGHLVVVYRNHTLPANAETITPHAAHLARLGLSLLQIDARTESSTIATLLLHPEVATVLHDRYVTAHALQIAPVTPRVLAPPAPISIPRPIAPVQHPISITESASATDTLYNSPQGWAVLAAGGFGDSVPNPTSTNPSGPWNTSRGAGVRIAVLDSGIDAQHPDLAPNLALNLSDIIQSQLPSSCDDGTPQDQQGHGTFTASLAAAAIGGGNVVGLAPQATLLNIKVLQRMPATTSTSTLANCEAGEAGGLLSWVLQGIDDAVANHANIISLSLGTLIDTTTGDGAGWQAQFNAATYAAAQAGIVIVAALGNDGLNLNSTLIELPAQSRSVLPVVASTNPACAEDITPGATCRPGPVTRPFYSNFGVANAISAPGGNYPQGPGLSQTSAPSGFITGACTSGLPNTTDGLPSTGQSQGCFNLGHTPYVQAIGTSAAAPLVAGAAAILHAAHPLWTPTQIIATLQSTATPTSTQPEPHLNLPNALSTQ